MPLRTKTEADELIEEAAHDLYEALKAVMFSYGKLIAVMGAFTNEHARAIDQATAALNKAEGRG